MISTESPSETSRSLWNQVKLGEGTPSAKQVRLHGLPAVHVPFTSGPSTILGYTTERKTQRMHERECAYVAQDNKTKEQSFHRKKPKELIKEDSRCTSTGAE